MKSQLRKFAMAGATFLVALAIGFVMQNGDALASRLGVQQRAASAVTTSAVLPIEIEVYSQARLEVDRALAGPVMASPEAPDTLSASVVLPQTDVAPVAPETPVHLASLEFESNQLPDLADVSGNGGAVGAIGDCQPVLSASVMPAAMVHLTLAAPCSPSAPLLVHHQGMMFSVLTDAAGNASVDVPALASLSIFIAAFDNGAGAVATVAVPEVVDFDRSVLLWQGQTGLQIDALEFGADYGSEGHVWYGAQRTAAAAADGKGFLIRIGDEGVPNPLFAEIYSFPHGAGVQSGEINLSVQAEITSENCGHDIAAQSIQFLGGEASSALDLTMSMPDCSAIGDYILLGDMFKRLIVASGP